MGNLFFNVIMDLPASKSVGSRITDAVVLSEREQPKENHGYAGSSVAVGHFSRRFILCPGADLMQGRDPPLP